jgi:hypothetical protein
MKYIPAILLCLSMTACTCSFIQTDTHGTASDVVDDTATPKTDLEATIPLTK